MIRRWLTALALVLTGVLIPSTPAAAVPIGGSELLYRTNGPVHDQEILNMAQSWLAVGGAFTTITVGGRTYNASNLAVINTVTGALLYAGRVNGTVRAVAATDMRLYIGGDFSQVDGSNRKFAAALDVGNWAVTGWYPSGLAQNTVFDIAFDGAKVYVATAAWVRAVDRAGNAIWVVQAGGGPVRVLLVASWIDRVYIGGLFESIAGFNQHGLIAVTAGGGQVVTDFRVYLRPDTGVGDKGGYDGESPIALGWDGMSTRLVMGNASAKGNYIRAVNPMTGSGAGMEFTHHQLEGDVQAVSIVPWKGKIAYLSGTHRNHGQSPENPCATGYYLTAWPSQAPAPDGCDLDWDGSLWGTPPANGVQSIEMDWTTLKAYVAGDQFTSPYNTTAVTYQFG